MVWGRQHRHGVDLGAFHRQPQRQRLLTDLVGGRVAY